MTIPFVDLGAYHSAIRDRLLEATERVFDSSAFILGGEVTAFEEAFARYCGTRHAIGVANGTDALTLALRALELGPDDEVIAPANTYIATVEAIALAGARPVLVDVDPRTRNIDPELIEAAITERTRALLPVHLYGRPADLDAIGAIARARELLLVEDAAQAHGALLHGRRAGGFGVAGCFSFYPGKNLGALGDGGAVVTDDDAIARRIRELGNHGGVAKYEHLRVATNSRLDGLQAALLGVKLDDLDARNARRREIAALYNAALADVPDLVTPLLDVADGEQVFHLYVIEVPAERRDELAAHLQEHGVASGIHYPTPVHLTAAFAHLGYGPGAFPHSEALSKRILSLPMFPELTDEEAERVAELVRGYLTGAREPATEAAV